MNKKANSPVSKNYLYEMNIYLSTKVTNYKRSYLKLPAVLPQVKAITTIIMIPLKIIVTLFVKVSYKQMFVNTILDFTEEDEEDKKM